MRHDTLQRCYFRMVLAAVWLLPAITSAQTQPDGTWTNGDVAFTLADIHGLGGAALLGNGKVIAAGGIIPIGAYPGSPTAHVYDPDLSIWTAAVPLNTGRWSIDAVSLNNGKALFPGGSTAELTGGGFVLATAEVFDPATNSFSYTANNLSVARHAYGISALNDGRIIITGGSTAAGNLGGGGVTAVDIYDPDTNSFTPAAPMNAGRSLHAQVTLQDGRVVVVGGARRNAEVYDPTTDTWISSVGTLPTTLKDMSAFELFNGLVFIPGGQNTANGLTTDDTRFFDPDTGLFSPGPSMSGFNYAPPGKSVFVGTSDYSAFDMFADVPSRRGRYILIAGGENDPLVGDDNELHSASIYDALTNAFYDVGPMPFVHDDHTESELGTNAAGNPEFLLFGGNSSPGTSRFEFHVPNRDPIANAGDDQIVECQAALTTVTLDGRLSSDPDGDELEYEWSVPEGSGATLDDPTSATPTGSFPFGSTTVTLTVTDGNTGIDFDDVLISVEDTTPPVLECTTDFIALWPPNHKMRNVEICVLVSDNCAQPEDLLLACRVSSNEPDDATGDGRFTGDVDGHDGFSDPVMVSGLEYDPEEGCYFGIISLRAERDGGESGRTYSIVCDVIDSENNITSAGCAVVVPHHKRRD